MAAFVKIFKIMLIIIVTRVTDIQVRAYAVTKNIERSTAGVQRSPSVKKTDVRITGMTSSEDKSTVVPKSFMHSMKQQFLKRLGIETLHPRRSKRSKWSEDAVPEYLTEILLKFQIQTKKNWIHSQQKEKETIVLGIMPYKVLSVNKKRVKVSFHLSAVLKLGSMALAEIVVRQPNATTANERKGRANFRSLVVCRESDSNDSCRILAHKPVTRRSHFDIYDVTGSLEEWWTEQSMSSAGGNCSDCSIVMTGVYRGASGHLPDLSDLLLVVSNHPFTDPLTSDNSNGTEHQNNGHLGRSETRPVEDDSKFAVELRNAGRRRREVTTCSLRSWYLDFEKLGWTTWIRYPEGYYANYCWGSCVSPSLTSPGNMTNHAFVKGLYRMALQSESPVPQATIDGLPVACCVPVRLSPINVLYRNDKEQWIIREMNEMVADQCGCL